MTYTHDGSGAAFAQQRADEAEALHQNAAKLMMEYRLLWQQERTETTRLRAERDAARAAAAAWKRSAAMWRAAGHDYFYAWQFETPGGVKPGSATVGRVYRDAQDYDVPPGVADD